MSLGGDDSIRHNGIPHNWGTGLPVLGLCLMVISCLVSRCNPGRVFLNWSTRHWHTDLAVPVPPRLVGATRSSPWRDTSRWRWTVPPGPAAGPGRAPGGRAARPPCCHACPLLVGQGIRPRHEKFLGRRSPLLPPFMRSIPCSSGVIQALTIQSQPEFCYADLPNCIKHLALNVTQPDEECARCQLTS
jgi:hypothetical protein